MRVLKCLGTGTGATNFITGRPSSAYLLCSSDYEELLIDCGAGVGGVVLGLTGGALPRHVFLSHNHTDHTGDLPVYLALSQSRQLVPTNLYGHRDVLGIVSEHRLHELNAAGRAPNVRWHHGEANLAVEACGLQLELFRTSHSYLCYGFLARDLTSGSPIFGWTADSGFNTALYKCVAKAPIVVAHARLKPSSDHASFADVENFAQQHKDTEFLVSHYGETTYRTPEPNVTLLAEGSEVELG